MELSQKCSQCFSRELKDITITFSFFINLFYSSVSYLSSNPLTCPDYFIVDFSYLCSHFCSPRFITIETQACSLSATVERAFFFFYFLTFLSFKCECERIV